MKHLTESSWNSPLSKSKYIASFVSEVLKYFNVNKRHLKNDLKTLL